MRATTADLSTSLEAAAKSLSERQQRAVDLGEEIRLLGQSSAHQREDLTVRLGQCDSSLAECSSELPEIRQALLDCGALLEAHARREQTEAATPGGEARQLPEHPAKRPGDTAPLKGGCLRIRNELRWPTTVEVEQEQGRWAVVPIDPGTTVTIGAVRFPRATVRYSPNLHRGWNRNAEATVVTNSRCTAIDERTTAPSAFSYFLKFGEDGRTIEFSTEPSIAEPAL